MIDKDALIGLIRVCNILLVILIFLKKQNCVASAILF